MDDDGEQFALEVRPAVLLPPVPDDEPIMVSPDGGIAMIGGEDNVIRIGKV